MRGFGKEIHGDREEFVGKGKLPSQMLISPNAQNRTIRQGERDYGEGLSREERREGREIGLLDQDAGASGVRNEAGGKTKHAGRDMQATQTIVKHNVQEGECGYSARQNIAG
jgi:hypothetical protein